MLPGIPDTTLKPQPLVIVFNSKPRKLCRKHPGRPQTPSRIPLKKTFAFVNLSRPGPTDEESRRLVKTHAMQDVLRRQLRKEACSSKNSPSHFQTSSQGSVVPSPRPPPSSLLTFPIQTEPYMFQLLHDCMYTNPLFSS